MLESKARLPLGSVARYLLIGSLIGTAAFMAGPKKCSKLWQEVTDVFMPTLSPPPIVKYIPTKELGEPYKMTIEFDRD